MRAMKVHWKLEWLKRPVFRRSVRSIGAWVKSKTEPMPYSAYEFYINRLGKNTGLEDELTSYCFRRGTSNAIDGKASDAIRDQVMRHDPYTGVFNGAYINESVRFNVQDAFLNGEISEDGLTRAFAHMSIRCNPGAPKEVPQEMMQRLLEADPDIAGLEQQAKDSSFRLRCEYGCINRAPSQEQDSHKELRNQLKNAKKSLKTEMDHEYRKHYFYQVHVEMMKMQLQRDLDTAEDEDTEEPEPPIEHQLEERMWVQQLLCDLKKDLSPEDIVSRKVFSIDAMTALASRQEPQTHKPRSAPVCEGPIKKEPLSPAPISDPFPQLDEDLRIGKTQCIFCIGNERLSYDKRTRAFKRVSHMLDHVEQVHLKHLDKMIPCGHHVCKAQGLVFEVVDIFKNHVATVHKINLRRSSLSY